MAARILTLALLLALSPWPRADMLVIVNAANSTASLERRQVIDLFMGRVTAFPGGTPAQTLDFTGGSDARSEFYLSLTGKSEAQVDAYWATLIFAGRMAPPRQLDDAKAMIRAVAANRAAIGYVPRQPLPADVKVVMELKCSE